MTRPSLASTREPSVPAIHVLALIPLGIALNLALGGLIHALKVPLYLDAIGTITVTLLAGIRAGVLVGVTSFLLGGAIVDPVMPWFSGTQAAIAIYCGLVASKGGFRSHLRAILSGVGLGVVAGVVSAPVIAGLFGGVTGVGASFITALLLASGKTLLNSVLLSGLASEPLDKTLQCVLAIWLLRGLPRTLLQRFRSGYLAQNAMVGPV